MIIGGETWGQYPQKAIFYLNMSSHEHQVIGQIDDYALGSAWAYYESNVYIHGGFSAVGDLMRYQVPNNRFVRIDLLSTCQNKTDCYWDCSPGTYKDSFGNCEICAAGSFNSIYGKGPCELCPKGSFNPYNGAQSPNMCYPCEENTYNDKIGSPYCKDCPVSSTCTAGSIKYEHHEIVSNEESIQPKLYDTSDTSTSANVKYTQFTIGLTGIFVLIFLLVLHQKKNTLTQIDIFKESHNHNVDQVMYLRKTPIGGFFSVIFMVLALILIVVAILNYQSSNIIENKSLVPLLILEAEVDKFIADIRVVTTLMHYGGECVDALYCNSTDCTGPCSSQIKLTILNIVG